MTISSELTTLNSAKQSIKAAIQAKGGNLTSVPFTQYGTAISNLPSGTPGIPAYPAAGWTTQFDTDLNNYFTTSRPSNWLSIPSITASENKFIFLVATKNSAAYSRYAFSITNNDSTASTLTVNWGDGSTENFAISANETLSVSHQYNYSILSSSVLDDGTKQVVITGSCTQPYVRLNTKSFVSASNSSSVDSLLQANILEYYAASQATASFLIGRSAERVKIFTASNPLLCSTLGSDGENNSFQDYTYLKFVIFLVPVTVFNESGSGVFLRCESLIHVKGITVPNPYYYNVFSSCTVKYVDDIIGSNGIISNAVNLGNIFSNTCVKALRNKLSYVSAGQQNTYIEYLTLDDATVTGVQLPGGINKKTNLITGLASFNSLGVIYHPYLPDNITSLNTTTAGASFQGLSGGANLSSLLSPNTNTAITLKNLPAMTGTSWNAFFTSLPTAGSGSTLSLAKNGLTTLVTGTAGSDTLTTNAVTSRISAGQFISNFKDESNISGTFQGSTNTFLSSSGVTNGSTVNISSISDGGAVTLTAPLRTLTHAIRPNDGNPALITGHTGSGTTAVYRMSADLSTATDITSTLNLPSETTFNSVIVANEYYLAYANGRYFVSNNSTKYATSTDGINWTVSTNPGNITAAISNGQGTTLTAERFTDIPKSVFVSSPDQTNVVVIRWWRPSVSSTYTDITVFSVNSSLQYTFKWAAIPAPMVILGITTSYLDNDLSLGMCTYNSDGYGYTYTGRWDNPRLYGYGSSGGANLAYAAIYKDKVNNKMLYNYTNGYYYNTLWTVDANTYTIITGGGVWSNYGNSTPGRGAWAGITETGTRGKCWNIRYGSGVSTNASVTPTVDDGYLQSIHTQLGINNYPLRGICSTGGNLFIFATSDTGTYYSISGMYTVAPTSPKIIYPASISAAISNPYYVVSQNGSSFKLSTTLNGSAASFGLSSNINYQIAIVPTVTATPTKSSVTLNFKLPVSVTSKSVVISPSNYSIATYKGWTINAT